METTDDKDGVFNYFDRALSAWLQHDAQKLEAQNSMYSHYQTMQPVQQQAERGTDIKKVLILAIGAALIYKFVLED